MSLLTPEERWQRNKRRAKQQEDAERAEAQRLAERKQIEWVPSETRRRYRRLGEA